VATGKQNSGPVTLIWEREVPDVRGVDLTREQIAEAAFLVAEAENLQAVSLKRVASKLGVPALRLEAYLTTRADLLDLMLDVAYGEIALPDAQGGDWRADLREIAEATMSTAAKHPWLLQLVGTRPPYGPNGLRNSERALASLSGVGLDVAAMTQAVNAVLAYVYGFVQIEMVKHARTDDAEGTRQVHTAEYLLAEVSSGAYPNLSALFAGGAALTAEQAFETGLDYVLDGIEKQIGAAGT
jgi:AcrR family transcriptional regulator